MADEAVSAIGAEQAKPNYRLPTPVLEEQHYSYAIVVELQRIRAAIEKLAGTSEKTAEVALREPSPEGTQKPKPKRGDI